MIYRHTTTGSVRDFTILTGPTTINGTPMGVTGDGLYTTPPGDPAIMPAAVLAAEWIQINAAAVQGYVDALRSGTATVAQLNQIVLRMALVMRHAGLLP